MEINEYCNCGMLRRTSSHITSLYNKALHSNLNINLEDEVNNFKNFTFGIISCVYIFGEGFDLPKLNGVVIGEKMTSDIRIVQSCLRPNRIEKDNPNKKAYIIIPTNISSVDDKIKSVLTPDISCPSFINSEVLYTGTLILNFLNAYFIICSLKSIKYS